MLRPSFVGRHGTGTGKAAVIAVLGAAAAELEKYVSDKKMAPIKRPYSDLYYIFLSIFSIFFIA